MNQPPSSFFDLNEDQHDHDHDHDHLFNLSPSLTLSYPPQDQGEFFYRQPQGFQLQPPLKADHKIVSSGGSCDHHNPRAEESESDNNDLKLSIWRNDVQQTIDDHEKHTTTHKFMDDSVKWTSSKMRMMRKMIITNPDQHHHNHHHNHTIIRADDHHKNFIHHKLDHHHHHHHHHHHQVMKNKHSTPMASPLRADHSSSSSSNIINNTNNNINGTIRVCSDCNTTKTPLWRSGPRGPKSLCNACGIRQRKARRAMAAAAAAAANGTVVSVEANSTMKSTTSKIIQHKEKKSKSGGGVANNPQFKKRCNKLASQPRGRKKLLCTFEDLRIRISKNSAFNRVFPQDEKDAAILLMALSYGLVHG